MESPSLDDAFQKLRWARHHFETLRPAIEAFEKRDVHRFTVDVNHDTGEYVFHVHDLEVPDPNWGLMVGDCIHNARTALDYLVVRLWALVTGIGPGDISDFGFPIYLPKVPATNPSKEGVEKAYAAARDQFQAFASKCRKQPGFSGYLTRIEELQPYNQGNVSIWGTGMLSMPYIATLPNALARLSDLDNADKHRVPHVTWASINVFGGPDIGRFAPEGFKSQGGSSTFAPLENNAEVGRWRFETPLPSEWEPSQVDMQRSFPLQVAFGEPSIFQGVLEVLPLCLWAADAVLTIFKPVFVPGNPQPPLPVTAIGEPGP